MTEELGGKSPLSPLAIAAGKFNEMSSERVAALQLLFRQQAEERVRGIVSLSMLRDLPAEKPGDRIGAHRTHLAASASPLGLINPGRLWQERGR